LCEQALSTLKVKPGRIRKEISGPPCDITLESGWPGISPFEVFDVIEERSGRSFKARAGEPLMISMEKAGITPPAVCRSGECTACRTRLVTGKVFAPARVHRHWVDEKHNYIHPCMSYPVEDLNIRL
jgi:glycine betaine catabolism B